MLRLNGIGCHWSAVRDDRAIVQRVEVPLRFGLPGSDSYSIRQALADEAAVDAEEDNGARRRS